MKRKWIACLCGVVCTVALLAPFGSRVGNNCTEKNVVYAAEGTQYDGTMVIPAMDRVKTVEDVLMQGTISNTNAEDVYLLQVEESALTLTLEGNTDGMDAKMELQTLQGTTLKSVSLNDYSEMEDTSTALRRSSIQNYYLTKGEYLCKISKNGYKNGALSYTIKAHAVDAAETKNISFGSKYLSYAKNVQYKKITVKASGKIIMDCNRYKKMSEVSTEQSNYANGDQFILCDKNKKELTGGTVNTNSKCYGVKKGTYYIKMKNVYTDEYRVYSVFFVKSDLTGNEKKSAKTITNRWKGYTLLSGDNKKSTAQWFKVTIKKPKKVKLYVNNLTDTRVTVEIYNKTRREGCIFVNPEEDDGVYRRVSHGKEAKWNKGTYYIRITKWQEDSKTGGIIKVKVK